MDHEDDMKTGKVPSAENVAMVEAARSHVDGHESFSVIYSRYNLLVRNCLFHYGIRTNDVDDLSQQVFMQAMQKLDQLEDPAALPGWLQTITHNAARSFHTRTKKLLCFSELTPDENTLPWIRARDQIPEERDDNQSAIVRSLIEQLENPLDRQMINEFYVQGLSVEEMTGIPDCDSGRLPPSGTIRRRLHSIRQRLSAKQNVLN